MKLKATDTVHITSVQAEPILKDEEFEIEDGQAQSLIERGLAVAVKAAATHADKAATPPANKAKAKA